MVFISVVSHNHSSFIMSNNELLRLNELPDVIVIINDNTGEMKLREYCKENGINYICSGTPKGFGENNNEVFLYIKEHFDAKPIDYFLVLNPDVTITVDEFLKLQKELTKKDRGMYTIDLFLDSEFRVRDPFIRRFPNALDFVKSFVLGKNDTVIDRDILPIDFDWCAGSFMCFSFDVYEELKGFDTSYFMYCEDIDICSRASRNAITLEYIPKVRAVHLAQKGNRNIFSKHFYWHVKSIIRFLLIRKLALFSKFFNIQFKSKI